MRVRQVNPSTPQPTRPGVVALAARAAPLLLLMVLPWFFGGVEPSAQYAGGWLLLAGFFLWAWSHAGSGPGLSQAPVPMVAVPIVVGICFGLLLLTPLAGGWLQWLSPQSHEYWTSYGTDPISLSGTIEFPEAWRVERWFSISVYPAGSRADIAMLVWLLAAFLLSSQLFSSRRAATALLTALAGVASLQAAFGLIQMMTWNGKLFWRYPMGHAGQPFGSFVNGNHSAALMSLGLAASIGLLYWTFRTAEATEMAATDVRGYLARAWDRLAATLVGLNAVSIAALASSVLIAAGLLASRSRGAVVATIAGAIATVCLIWLARRPGVKQLALVAVLALIAGMGGLGLLLFTELEGGLHEDLDSLESPAEAVRYRADHWRDGVRAAYAFRGVGSGMGSYRYVYRPEQRRLDDLWYYHAENQYLETFTELGLVGLTSLFMALAFALLAGWRLLLSRDRSSQALGVAGVFALVTHSIHAGFDFAWYLPAVGLAAALLCGAICGRAAELSIKDAASGWFAIRGPMGWALVAVAAPLSLLWSLSELKSQANVYREARYTAIADAPESREQAKVAQSQLLARLRRLEAALGARPDDLDGRLSAVAICRDLYRLERVVASDVAAEKLTEVWLETEPFLLHGLASRDPETLQTDNAARQYLRRGLNHAIWARRACPLEIRAHRAEALMSPAWTSRGHDQVAASRAVQLSRMTPDTYLFAGVLAHNAGRPMVAGEYWRRCLLIDPSLASRVVDIGAALGKSDVDVYREYFPLVPSLWLELAQRVRKGTDGPAKLRKRAVVAERLEQAARRVSDPVLRDYWVGVARELQDDLPSAVQRLEKAVRSRPEDAVIRFELVQSLLRMKEYARAKKHLEACLLLDQGNTIYQDKMQTIQSSLEQSAKRADGSLTTIAR